MPRSEAATAVTQVSTNLAWSDIFGAWKVRWGIKRYDYKVKPGLYAVGQPDRNSPVLVSANYKLSFDMLRKELGGLNLWIMVIDTRGINVWCAAGKGTFGTEEIIERIQQVQLAQQVSHRTLILPQLGAPGVAGYQVLKATGFRIIYGPVQARDLPAFLQNGLEATPKMRKVEFPFWERLILTPVELVGSLKYVLWLSAFLFVLNTLKPGSLTTWSIYTGTLRELTPYLGAVLIGAVLVPALLPWIPGRAFFWKGWLVGLGWALFVNYAPFTNLTPFGIGIAETALLQSAYLLLLPVIAGFLALNFTGCSTYTSLSGVQKEMNFAIPVTILALALGLSLILVNTLLPYLRGV